MFDTSKTLLSIGNEWLELDAALEATGGELHSPEIEARFLAIAEQLARDEGMKLDNAVNYIRRKEAEAKAAKEEAERYIEHAAWRENAVRRVKELLRFHLERTGRSRIESATGRVVAIQKNGGKVPIIWAESINPQDIPDDLAIVKRSPNPEAVRERLEAGEPLSFATLGTAGQHLRIK